MSRGGESKFTKKEIQLFQFLHSFCQRAKGGEVKIVFHNHEPQDISLAQFNIVLTGQVEDPDFEKHLTSILKFDNII